MKEQDGDCPECIELDQRLKDGADNLERLALAKGTPARVTEQLQACARTVRRGLKLSSKEHKLVVLEDYELLLVNIMLSAEERRTMASVLN